ncbi:MAG: hypothetical protein ABR584_05950 [Candidatus Baltobacteraceae bacterium]
MRKLQSSVWAGLFSAAICCLTGTIATASPNIDGTYAAVTPQNVELLTLRSQKGQVHGTYRVLHVNPGQPDGLDDQRTALSAADTSSERAFALADTRTMILRFDSSFQHAVATTGAVPAGQTQSFSRVTADQLGLLVEMARYGGLYEVCRTHRDETASLYSKTFCAGMAAQLTDIVPFRPFPQAHASRPVVAYELRARLARKLALNP